MNIASRGASMAVDWEQRVDFPRLRRERLERVRKALAESDLGALLLFDPNNIRYVTSTHIGEWARDKNARWVLMVRGEDPILWTDRFTLEGSGASDVRRSVRKAESKGLVVRHFLPGEPGPEAALVDQLRVVSNEWLHSRHGGEKGFCMGRFDTQRLRDVWLLAAWNPAAQRVEAFTTWVPIPARLGWALDLGRRRHDGVPGAMVCRVARSRSDSSGRPAYSCTRAISLNARACAATSALRRCPVTAARQLRRASP